MGSYGTGLFHIALCLKGSSMAASVTCPVGGVGHVALSAWTSVYVSLLSAHTNMPCFVAVVAE